MTFSKGGIATLFVLAALAVSAGADDTAVEAARESVEQFYGQRIAEVGRTDTTRDDLALAEELLAAARQADRAAAERFVLADTAAVLVAPLGTQAGGEVARKAMVLAESIRPYPPATGALRLWQIESGRLARMQRNRADLAAVEPVADASARAGLAYIEALLADPDAAALAAQSLREIRTLINRYKLNDLAGQLQAADERIRRAGARNNRLADARRMLQQALDRNNQTAVAAARRELADVFITFDGDLLTAAQYIDGTGHHLEQAVKVAAAVQAGEPPDQRDELVEAVIALRDHMTNLAEPAFTRVGEHAIALCDAYVAGATDGPQRVTGRLYRMQINKLLGSGLADVMLAELAEAYDVPLHCSLQTLGNRRARISYDFEDPRQLGDWTIQRRQWQVADALVHVGGAGGDPASIATRLRFRADQPVRVSLRASAFDEIAVLLAFHDWGQDDSRTAYQTYFRGPRRRGRRGTTGPGGLQLITPRNGHRWADDTRLLASDSAYDVELAIDGTGGVTWRINGVLVHEYLPAPGEPTATAGSVTVQLLARGASVASPTGYDDVVIEGEVLPDPNWRPDEED